ncbi:MAG: hypothetical protein WCT77_07525, partial [Bacteroidota bacterium]
KTFLKLLTLIAILICSNGCKSFYGNYYVNDISLDSKITDFHNKDGEKVILDDSGAYLIYNKIILTGVKANDTFRIPLEEVKQFEYKNSYYNVKKMWIDKLLEIKDSIEWISTTSGRTIRFDSSSGKLLENNKNNYRIIAKNKSGEKVDTGLNEVVLLSFYRNDTFGTIMLTFLVVFIIFSIYVKIANPKIL